MLSFFATVPIVIAVLLFVSPFKKITRMVAALAQAALFGLTFYVFLLCKDGDIVTRVGDYEGFLGIVLRVDTLTSVFLMLASFVFLIATVYSFNEKFSRLFWFFLFIWQGLLNGVFMTNDVFNIFVLIELATVVVSVLIMFNRDNRSMYDGMVYMMVNIVAMQFFLFGVGYLYKLTGTLDMTAAAQMIGQIDKSSLVLPYALIMTAVSLKCALMPLFSWLPKAHGTPGAPSAVSAILSGLHIKSGVYLFIRFQHVFAGVSSPVFFLTIGIITGLVGALLALSQTDVKLMLAYSTVSQIGLIMIGLNVSDVYSYTGSLYHIINHALFKSALFMSAGIITHAYGTRDITRIRGVMRRFPLVGAATLMAVLGITGTPFFNGSISKYFISAGVDWMVNVPVIIINLGTIIVFIKYSAMLFGHKTPEQLSEEAPHALADSAEEVPLALADSAEEVPHASADSADEVPHTHPDGHRPDACKQAAVLVLGAFCLAGGIFGVQSIKFLFNISVNVSAAGYIEKTALFALSAIAGYLIYRFFIDKSPFFQRIRDFDLNFRLICASIGGFFAVTLIVAHFFAA